jgi:hypothetical protein
MAKAGQSKKKAKTKTKSAAPKAERKALNQVVIEKLRSQPLGKSLSALDSIYQELDDVADRLEILICRIEILRQRTAAFKRGDFTTLDTMLSGIGDLRKLTDAVAAVDGATSDKAETSSNAEPKWVELTLLKETEINNVKLSEGTVVSVEEQSSKKLVEDGYASLNEAEQTKEEADENTSEETVE